jgi:hypothetical protein
VHERRGYGVKIATERCFVGARGTQENGGESEPRERVHVEIDKDARVGIESISFKL